MLNSGVPAGTEKAKLESKKYPLTAAAVIEATDIGATALIENLRNRASCANTIPAIGALNPDEMAAATPQAISTSDRMNLPENFVSNVEIVAPKCTKGPY